MNQDNFHGQLTPGGIAGPNVLMQPFDPQGLEPHISQFLIFMRWKL